MSYRSLTRVIGETSLERKCRLLFGACITLLVAFSFTWVENIAEGLVEGQAIRKARDLVDAALLRYHWEDVWETDPQAKELARELSRDLMTQGGAWKVLALEETATTQRPADAAEEAIVRQLKTEFQEQMRRRAHQAGAGAEADAARKTPSAATAPAGGAAKPAVPGDAPPSGQPFAGPPTDAKTAGDILPVHRFNRRADGDDIYYYYYQPVYWKGSCLRCHQGFLGIDSALTVDSPLLLDRGSYPFRVVKVKIAARETQDAITWNRAILLAIGIITVFLAMVVLYVIVRYVIARPLQHLRDVSEAISKGATEQRAEIHTGDEFEALAGAFNRMLRHMTDAQDQLQQMNRALDAKVDQLAQLNMRLYEMNRLKSDFLANMSHEVRTPLNSIIGFSEVLQGVPTLTDKQKRYAQNIQKSGRLLLDMINDILDLAKIEAGKMELRLTEFRIDALVQAQCDMVRALSEEKNIDVNVHVEPDLPPLYQDQSKIQQVLINLLSNAIKFTPEGGRITVTAVRELPERLKLSVADTGVGIPEQDRDIIFEKFRQSSATIGDDNLTREYTGTGLGLSIVKELCKLLGGEITFESELGKGSTFHVVLPWALPNPVRRESTLETQLEELTRAQRLEAHTPGPAATAN